VFLRLVSVIRAQLFNFQLRAYYYLLMRSVEDDEEAQKRGVVGCMYTVGSGGIDLDLKLIRKVGNLRNALPARFESFHVCYNDRRMSLIFSIGMIIMGTRSRMRFRAHYGSDEECQCKLSTFGIPILALPVSPGGEFNLVSHRTFMAIERSIEATKSEWLVGVAQKGEKMPEEKARLRQPIIKENVFVVVPQPVLYDPTEDRGFISLNNWGSLPLPSFANPWWNIVGAPNLPPVVPPHRQLAVVPQSHTTKPTSASRPPAKICESPAKSYVIHDPWPSDVLFGRGKPIQQRPGNVRFREIIDRHIDKYEEQGVNGTKVVASAYVVHLVKEEGGRFLKELKDGGFVEVDEATARAKTSHAFRTRRQLLQATLKKDKSTV
jgi:hypothetical protein